MDINKAIALLTDGKLRECSLDDLRAMSAASVVFIQNHIPDAIHLKAAVDDEILRKEAQEADRRAEQRHQALVAEQQHLKASISMTETMPNEWRSSTLARAPGFGRASRIFVHRFCCPRSGTGAGR